MRYDKGWLIEMKTTLNIHKDILEIITRAAKKRGVSRSDLIIYLFKMTMDSISSPCIFGSLVSYQKRSKPDDWHIFHIKLRVDEYEYFLDLRKLLKMSVSRILTYAVKRFLHKITKKNLSDNYQFKNYIIIKELFNNTICWKLVWGYPTCIDQLL
jgi:hypothetical protein